jgi:hypothetical protein
MPHCKDSCHIQYLDQFAQEFTEFAAKIATMPTVPTSAVTSSTAANELAAVLSSKAWRATAPLRKLCTFRASDL